MNKITVSVGIPAHNEEANISTLLQSLLSQSEKNYQLKEIIVAADGCTDGTVQRVTEVKDKRIRIINDGQRKGKSARLNEIMRLFSGDIIIFIDADIVIKNKQLFDTIIASVDFSKAGLVSPNYVSLPAANFFEKCLHLSLDVQVDLRKKWNNGKNYLSFKGAFMALGKNFAKTIQLPKKLVNDDGYIYFKALERGYTPAYLPDVCIYYKTPDNFKDYVAQSSRYQASEGELSKFVTISEKDYTVPKSLYYTTSLKYLLQKPLYMIGYLFIRVSARLVKKKQLKSTWVAASSTKKI